MAHQTSLKLEVDKIYEKTRRSLEIQIRISSKLYSNYRQRMGEYDVFETYLFNGKGRNFGPIDLKFAGFAP